MVDNGGGFTIHIDSESMPDMRRNRPAKKAKKKPKMVQASFQAGEPQVSLGQSTVQINTCVGTSAEELKDPIEVQRPDKHDRELINDGGFQISMVTSSNEDNEADAHFKRMRQQDKEAYETKINNQFGFEEAQPKPEGEQ